MEKNSGKSSLQGLGVDIIPSPTENSKPDTSGKAKNIGKGGASAKGKKGLQGFPDNRPVVSDRSDTSNGKPGKAGKAGGKGGRVDNVR